VHAYITSWTQVNTEHYKGPYILQRFECHFVLSVSNLVKTKVLVTF